MRASARSRVRRLIPDPLRGEALAISLGSSRTSLALIEESLRERMSSDPPDTIHLGPRVRSGREKSLNTSESLEQRTRRRMGDTANTAQHGKPRRQGSATRERPRHPLPPFLADREPVQPLSRIGWISGADDCDSEIGDREQTAAYRVGMPWAVVDVRTLDEQEREHGCIPYATDLRPEPAASERAVKVRHGLSLDQRPARDPVITGAERLNGDLSTKSLKARGDAAAFLEDIRHDDRREILFHAA